MLKPTPAHKQGNSKKPAQQGVTRPCAKAEAAQLAITKALVKKPLFGQLQEKEKSRVALREALKPYYPPMPDAVEALSYLPIEAFKYQADALAPPPDKIAARFYSSGTSSADRSISTFSELGLSAYLQQARASFLSVVGEFFENPQSVPGLSLIPQLKDWPDSSLAHMLDDLAQSIPVTFITNPRQLVDLDQAHWIFGTAFHFVNLFDQGFRCQLPQGSIIFETGGSKGRSREVSRKDLYLLISEMFGLSQNAIISEYGMSELACQAYDYVGKNVTQPLALHQRCFRFPHWVDVQVLSSSEQLHSKGFGSLVISDPLRIDAPWPIRTQDLVSLTADGRFQLHGRVPSSSLKGCSLRVSELATQPPVPVHSGHNPHFFQVQPEKISSRSQAVWENLTKHLTSRDCLAVFESYFGDRQIARWAQQDIISSLPRSAKDLARAALESVDAGKTPCHWLVIGPQSHPFAIFHPLILASVLDIQVTLRFSHTGQPIENWLIEVLRDAHATIATLPAEFRLTGAYPEADAIMIFGEDKTVQDLSKITGQLIQGFGSHLAVGVMDLNESSELGAKLLRDAFSIKQQGCRSLRAVIFGHDSIIDPESFHEQLQRAQQNLERSWQISQIQLNETEQIALQHDKVRRLLLAHHSKDEASLKFPIIDWNDGQELEDMLSPCPFVLPIVSSPKQTWRKLANWLKTHNQVHGLGLSPKALSRLSTHLRPEHQSHRLGQGQSIAWNGKHDGKRLFSHSASSLRNS